MEKYLKLKLAGAGILVLAIGILLGLKLAPQPVTPVGYSGDTANSLDHMSYAATTTLSQLPVKLIGRDQKRTYALIQNPPTNSVNVALHFANFTDPSAASTTVGFASSTAILVPGGHYEILPENLYTQDVWATSTASSVKINVMYQ